MRGGGGDLKSEFRDLTGVVDHQLRVVVVELFSSGDGSEGQVRGRRSNDARSGDRPRDCEKTECGCEFHFRFFGGWVRVLEVVG